MLAAMMFLQYFGLGAWVVPLTRYLQTLPVNGGMGFTPPEVALIYTTFAIGAFIAPMVVGLLADRWFPVERVIAATHAVMALLMGLAAMVVSLAFVLLVLFVFVVLIWIVLSLFNVVPDPDRRWPRLSAWGLVAIPVVALLLAFVLTRGGEGRTFYAQQAANRRVSLLLLVAMGPLPRPAH